MSNPDAPLSPDQCSMMRRMVIVGLIFFHAVVTNTFSESDSTVFIPLSPESITEDFDRTSVMDTPDIHRQATPVLANEPEAVEDKVYDERVLKTNRAHLNTGPVAGFLKNLDNLTSDTVCFFGLNDVQREAYLDSVDNVFTKLSRKYSIYHNVMASPVFISLLEKNVDLLSETELKTVEEFLDWGHEYSGGLKCQTVSCDRLERFRLNISKSSLDPERKMDLDNLLLNVSGRNGEPIEHNINVPDVIIKRPQKTSWVHWLASGLFIPGTPLLAYGIFIVANTMHSNVGYWTIVGVELASLGAIMDIGGAAIITIGEMRRMKYDDYRDGRTQLYGAFPEKKIMTIDN